MSRPGLALCLFALLHLSSHAADPIKVQELRIQKVGEITYFHVRIAKTRMAAAEQPEAEERTDNIDLSVFPPCLVSPDGKLKAIYPREGLTPVAAPARSSEEKDKNEPKPRDPVPVEGMEFVGKTLASGEVKLTLFYPSVIEPALDRPARRREQTAGIVWKEGSLTLDISKANAAAIPSEAKTRTVGPVAGKAVQPAVRDDLEGLWAEAQIAYFARLKGQGQNFGFYPIAAEATARKYNVPRRLVADQRMVPVQIAEERTRTVQGKTVNYTVVRTAMRPVADESDERADKLGRLYEMTTGAASIAESLALRRMTAVPTKEEGKRITDVAKIAGIDIEEHPWRKMMAGKKPADEPLASLVPHDNYYLHFNSTGKFFDLADMIGQWGDSLGRAFTLQSRDFRIKERYLEQLCLRKGGIGRRAGGFILKGVAVTGSDPYLREGSDLTFIFHTNRKDLFLNGLDVFTKETRQKHGAALKESKSEHLGISIDSFVTPLREVSLHRAVVGDYVICSNSPAGLRRVLDAHKGKIKRLSEALDFQYMRTVFRADDKDEDGFLFLSDAFIRQIVGPASKIKEKRRLEALTSLYMLTHGALFTAWETGKLPGSHKVAVEGANLKAEEVPMPEGKAASWDAERQAAVSEVYNTIHFATPLIELPIEKATKAEVEQYNRFRLEYLGLWRQYFDPIGMRFRVSDSQVKVETYILPLVKNTQYDTLRRITGGGTFGLDTGNVSPETLFSFLMHLSPNIEDRFGELISEKELGAAKIFIGALGPIGSWVQVRIDDSPVFNQLLDIAERSWRGDAIDSDEAMRLVFQMPVVLGADIKNPLTFGALLATMRTSVMLSLPGGVTWEPLEKPYRGVPIVRVQASAQVTQQLLKLDGKEARKRFQPAIYYAMIDGGFYLALNEKMIRSLVDQMEVRKRGEAKLVPVNSSLYLSPGAAKEAGKMLQLGLEYQTHQKALENAGLWHTLYRCGLIEEKSKAKDVAYRYFGFVPVSPDGAAYRHDAATDEVVNERHGSPRKPTLQKTLADDAPLGRLLEQLRSVRADLRFREDGIHTVLTIERQKPAK